MRVRILAVAVVAGAALVGCVPDIPDLGTVVAPSPCPITPCNPHKYLTVRGADGRPHTFRVRKAIFRACPIGAAWPTCKEHS